MFITEFSSLSLLVLQALSGTVCYGLCVNAQIQHTVNMGGKQTVEMSSFHPKAVHVGSSIFATGHILS